MAIVDSMRKRPKLFGGLLAFALLLLLFPVGIRLVLISELRDLGVGDSEIGDIDINLFTGDIGFEGWLLSRNGEEKLYLGDLRLNVDMMRLFLGELQVEEVHVRDSRLWLLEGPDGWEIKTNTSNHAAGVVDRAGDRFRRQIGDLDSQLAEPP